MILNHLFLTLSMPDKITCMHDVCYHLYGFKHIVIMQSEKLTTINLDGNVIEYLFTKFYHYQIKIHLYNNCKFSTI